MTEESSGDKGNTSGNNDSIRSKFSQALSKTKETQSSFRTHVSQAIRATNERLANLEDQWKPTREKIQKKAQQAQDEYERILGTSGLVVQAYRRRHEFAPIAIGASAVTFGGYAAIRRRSLLPAVASAVVASGCMYGIIYGFDEWEKRS